MAGGHILDAQVPEVNPVASPTPGMNIPTNPGMFGAFGAQAAESLGGGLEKTSSAVADLGRFFDKVNADDQVNKWITQKDQIMRGNPNQLGADGQPDMGYMGLRGRQAADARADTLKRLDQARIDGRKNLTSANAQLIYDEQTRRMYSVAADEIGSHANQQWTNWAGGVNQTGATHAMNAFVANLDNPQAAAQHADEYINFRIQEAQVKYGLDPDMRQRVHDQAEQELLENQVQVIGATDPAKAIAILNQHKDIAGAKYDNIYNALRARADKQIGNEAAADALRGTYQTVPGVDRVQPVFDSLSQKYGVSPGFLRGTWMIESGGKLNPSDSSTGARGPFQFIGPTARQYGVTNPNDFNQSAEGAARYAVANKAVLTAALRREPTDAELYLAHQQDGAGAAKLLLNPNARAGDLVGDRAIRVNGGNPDATAAEFTAMWTARFNGAGAAASQARKAAAYQLIDPRLTDDQRDHAVQRINRDIAMQQQAEELTLQARRLTNETAANEYTTKILTGQAVDMNAMATDPRLMAETKVHLTTLAENKGLIDDPLSYGTKYSDTYSRIFANPDDPNRITSIDQILRMGAPGGGLSAKGVDRLAKVFTESRNQKLGEHDPNAVNVAKSALLKSAEQKMARTQMIPGMGAVTTNINGERVFNSKFVPKFEAAYEEWIKKDKNPWEFLTSDNIDKMIDSVYPKAQRDKDSLEGAGEAQKPAENEPLPPSPKGVDNTAWTRFMADPPVLKNGNRMRKADWAAVLQKLHDDPSPETIKLFDESKFGQIGYRGAEIVKQLTGSATATAPAASAASLPAEATSPAAGEIEGLPELPKEYGPLDRRGEGPARYLFKSIQGLVPVLGEFAKERDTHMTDEERARFRRFTIGELIDNAQKFYAGR